MPTTLRVIDYVANPGGGVRFAVELLTALAHTRPGVRLQLVSHSAALQRYKDLLSSAGLTDIDYLDLAPTSTPWRFDIPAAALEDCDVVWLPWIHRHRLPHTHATKIVASFHDAILFQFSRLFGPLLPPGALDDERATMQDWFNSAARIVVSSNATLTALDNTFAAPANRFAVIPLSGEHAAKSRPSATLPEDWPWAADPFLLCPANISPHKNHEILLRGVAEWGRQRPLVLTGESTHLDRSKWSRAVTLRDLATQLGFTFGRTLHPLGYVPDEHYYALLDRAWALVMPTLAEGGGSFPVFEALVRGIPVVCSDIPVMREQMHRLNAHVLWFNPAEPTTLAAALADLDRDYPAHKSRATAQIQTLCRRTWSQVADDYWTTFDRPTNAHATL
jgi:glycosyltransferase involved in cell wall biosynthesis